MKMLLMVLFGLALVACGREAGEQSASDAQASINLRGEAFYFERIVMPSGSWLEIELFDEDADRSLYHQRLDDIEAPPYAFELTVAQSDWRPDGVYTVFITLFLPDGSPRFAAESAVDPDVRELQSIRLQPVDYSEQDEEVEEVSEWMAWRCGEIPVDVRAAGDDRIMLGLPWQDQVLRAEPSANGESYRGEAVKYWERGDSAARLAIENQPAIDCTPADGVSPWTAARERGIDFRASGNEPGWLVEVRNGDHARMDLLLDYGSRELTFDDVAVLPDQAGFKANAPGNQVEIQLIHETCHDTMVDWTFPVRVEMTLNDLQLSACGRFFINPASQ